MKNTIQFSILALTVIFWSACSVLEKDKDVEITTTYGFNASDVVAEFGEIDSMTVWVIDGGDTVDVLHFKGDDLDEKNIVRFPIDAASEAQVRVDYRIYAGGEAVAGGGQTFVSGETPTIPRPQRKPKVDAGADTTIERTSNFSFVGVVNKREENIKNYRWDYDGDGEWDADKDKNSGFSTTYDLVGSYLAVFRASDDLGLFDEDTVQITVVPLAPTLSLESDTTFSINDSLYLRAELTLDDSSKIDSTLLIWTLGAVVDSCFLASETCFPKGGRLFSSADTGTYSLKLAVVDAWKSRAEASVDVVVLQDIPVLDAGSDAAGFLNTQQLFDADAEQSYGNFVEFGWDFDGDTTAGWDSVFTENSAILYSYTSVGNYTALFYALDDDGNRVVDTRRMNITNPEAGSHPPQILTWTDRDTTVSIKDSVSFALTLFSDGGGNDDVKHFMWDLDGDGNYEIDLSGNASVGYRYPSAGVFTISLKLVDSNNDTNRVQSTITVLQGSPDAGTCTTADGYINTPSISMGTCGAVDDHTSGISGSIVMYAWDYNGDGVYDDSSATAVSFDHAWQDLSADTTYTAKLQLRDDDGNFSTTTRAVHVVNYAPVLSLTSPTAYISIGDQITFTATFSDADQNLASTFLWDSDLNGSLNWGSPTDTATHTRQVTFPNAGTFMVRVQLSDTWGSVSDSIEVTVQTAPPEIPGCSTTVTAYILSPDVDFGTCGALDTAGGGGTIVMYKWDYNGDGVYDDSSASTSFLHHYADLSADTTYNARLLVRDDDGNNADKLVLVQVQNRAPTISGSPKITPVGVGDSAWVSFPTLNTTDLDGNGIDSLYWDENDDGSIDFRTIFTDSVLLPFSTSSPIMVSVSLRDRWAAADTMAFSMGGAACIGGSFYDNRDGTTYSCVTIGTQVWMSENLNYDTADGTGSWCYANLPANCTTYGRLYNWNTVMAGASTSSATPSGVRGVCPEGWHVPSDNEWEVMAQYVADQTGNNAKSNTTWTQLGVNLKATSGWSSGNGTDDFGFSALPAGYYYGSSFYDEGSNAYFWSAAEDDATYAWSRGLFSGNEYLLRSYYDKSYGFSSRCIQD